MKKNNKYEFELSRDELLWRVIDTLVSQGQAEEPADINDVEYMLTEDHKGVLKSLTLRWDIKDETK